MNEGAQLVLVSNRGPASFSRDEETGEITATRGGGGLVTALTGLVHHRDALWISSAMGDEDTEVARMHDGKTFDLSLGDVERYAQALQIHPVAHLALEQFRWLVRSLPRPDGRRFARRMQVPIAAPVLHLHGDFDRCILPRTAQGSGRYVTGEYEWHVLEGVGHFPQNEVPEIISGELIRWAKLG